jgi:hypothetical protein
VREILLKPSEQDLAGTNKNTDVQIGNRVQAHKIDKKAVEWNAGPDREIRTDRFGWSFFFFSQKRSDGDKKAKRDS